MKKYYRLAPVEFRKKLVEERVPWIVAIAIGEQHHTVQVQCVQRVLQFAQRCIDIW